VVAVTGAGQGIGPAIVRGLAERGARVFARDIDLDALAVVRCVPGIAMATLDLTDRAAAIAWVREVERAGGGAIDPLVPTAGGVRGQSSRWIEDVASNGSYAIVAINFASSPCRGRSLRR
jgi:NAD(P)-dependent dehydrogenase (short-subunit alcohol dehydrogenase family)